MKGVCYDGGCGQNREQGQMGAHSADSHARAACRKSGHISGGAGTYRAQSVGPACFDYPQTGGRFRRRPARLAGRVIEVTQEKPDVRPVSVVNGDPPHATLRKLTAILYARVSSKAQAERGLSLPGQLRELREWAEREGYI